MSPPAFLLLCFLLISAAVAGPIAPRYDYTYHYLNLTFLEAKYSGHPNGDPNTGFFLTLYDENTGTKANCNTTFASSPSGWTSCNDTSFEFMFGDCVDSGGNYTSIADFTICAMHHFDDEAYGEWGLSIYGNVHLNSSQLDLKTCGEEGVKNATKACECALLADGIKLPIVGVE
ncbi:MAG: hypothetical protein M1834_007346 [Cirrosporium novae-zelandiae]|nr:MAG: hypothetical protein M1834_007346 [Cirrosporium novae-zelandiae]